MGLDAQVYCDCLEKGDLRNPLPKDATVKVYEDGYPVVVLNGEEIHADHPGWNDFACVHERRQLVAQRIGNISLVGLLRAELRPAAGKFPIITSKVIYNGCHAGDWLRLEEISLLQKELQGMVEFKCVGNLPSNPISRWVWTRFRVGWYHYTSATEANAFMKAFRAQMQELTEAALKVGKPISF
jgi:hypothetical protein